MTQSDSEGLAAETEVGWGAVSPFVSVAGVGVLTALVPFPGWNLGLLVLGVLAIAAFLAVMVTLGRTARDSWLAMLGPGLLLLTIGAARDYAGGAVSSGLAPLVLLPILWVALMGTRAQLIVFGLATALMFWLPAALIGPPQYPVSELRRGVLWLLIALVVAPVVQRLVQRQRRESAALRSERERTQRLFVDAPHGILVVRSDGTIIRANGAVVELVDHSGAAVLGARLQDFADDPHAVAQLLRDALSRPTQGHSAQWTVAARERWLAVTARALVDSDDVTILVHVVDISEQRRQEAELAHLADHDTLTGLLNRRRYEQELVAHEHRNLYRGPRGGALLIDLDRFKEVNDTLGHPHGDRLLIEVAQMLRTCVREQDVVARLGGDEFAILLTDGDAAVVERVAQAVVDGVAAVAAEGAGVVRRVTASVGGVTFEGIEGSDWDVSVLTDLAMYEAKDRGRNRYCVISPSNPALPQTAERLEWRNRIRDALDEGRLVLHVQPILELGQHRVRSAEALLRLREGDELFAPGVFLEAAGRSGLMPELDAWVVSHAIDVLTLLRSRSPDFRLNVNVTYDSIGDPRLEAALERASATLPAGALRLELTETAPIVDVAATTAFCARVRELGYSIALDDFGAGYSSYSHLKLLDVDDVKIDGTFVRAAPTSPVDRTIVCSLIALAHELGKTVTVEHVSDAEILDFVTSAGADHAQGFHIGRPVPVEEFADRFLTGADSCR